MQFGQNVNNRKVLCEVKRCVKKFGNQNMAKNIEEDGTLEGATDYCAEFLSGKSVPPKCDDLWSQGNIALGYLRELKKLCLTLPKAPF